MKKVWVKAVPWNKNIVTTALESGADAVLVPDSCVSRVKKLGIIKTIAANGDIRLGKDVLEFTIKSSSDVDKIARINKSKLIIVKTTDWTIIPLENLVAQSQGLIAEVRNADEARTALQILEKGVDGVLVNTVNLSEIKKIVKMVKETSVSLKLETAVIKKVKPLIMGDRVCIDTCTNMTIGQGMLVGNSSSAMFLIHSESIENPYVAQRPFRVNAGAVHAYTMIKDGKTKYLSEISVGDEVLLVDYRGNTREVIVGRSKTEKRPMMLVEASCKGKAVSLVLQNAETIRLTTPEGKPISVISLKTGKSRVLVYLEEEGRHFGIKVKESIVEK
jgi:3-dehydroquinate synthase II